MRKKLKDAEEEVDAFIEGVNYEKTIEVACNYCAEPFSWAEPYKLPDVRDEMVNHLLEFHGNKYGEVERTNDPVL